jgi:tetratricopeptide (TPR) repeat protein
MEILSKIFSGVIILFLATANIHAQTQSELETAFSESYVAENNGKYSQAVIVLTKVYKTDSYEINLRLGWLNYLAGQYTESITYYNNCIKLKPLSIEAQFGLTYPASAVGNWDQVANAYKEVLKIDHQNYTANLKLGQIYQNRTEYDKAEPLFKVVLNQYPFTYDVLIHTAWNNYYLGKTREAAVLFNKVMLLSPNDKSASEGLSKLR